VRVVWPRADVPQPGDPDEVKINGIYLNAVWAEQAKSVTKELVGSTSGAAGETFDLANHPVLAEEKVEVLELEGPLAEAGQYALLKELEDAGGSESDLALERDEKTGKVNAAWVTWQGRPNFSGSGPHDRHYVLERIRGSLQFGDGRAGRVPPVNANNVRVSYRTGGGKRGNQPARLISVVLGSVTSVQTVFNPIPTGGGADGEMSSTPVTTAPILERGPQLIRHRHRALTAADYEQLARSASPGVAVARVVTPASSGCLVPAGSVQVIILPHSEAQDPEPAPSPQLLSDVTEFIAKRAPFGVADGLTVVGPIYFRVGVDVSMVPSAAELAGQLSRDAKTSIARFLHPVLGGPEGQGWGFGQAVYRSDLVKWLHQDLKDALAYVEDLRLLSTGQSVPEQLDIPPDQVPCAGPIRVVVVADPEADR
jgi:predicted phage baseplate assembly protein